MDGSRRLWTTVAVGAMLVGVAVLLDRPAPLVGAAGIGAWLLATQLFAVRAFERDAAVDVNYTLERRSVAVDQPLRCRLVVERSEPRLTTVTATAPLPLAARGPTESDRTVTLDSGETRAATTFELHVPVAGRFEFDAPRLALTDALGLFSESLTRGPTPTVDVNTQGPRDIHIGRGGERTIAAYGEHTTDQRGPGLQPEELRQYFAGDPADSIDWKATARLNETFVREYRTETDRETILVVDHRAAMDAGSGGETMLGYAREVALAVVESASRATDPLALYTVGDSGLTARHPATTDPNGYTRARTTLQTLTATSPEQPPATATVPGRAHRADQRLRNDSSRFATRLRPFLASTDAYVHRLAGDPLFSAVQEFVSEADANQWTVIVTSDADPVRVTETVKLAARRSAAVLVFVTPQVLFDADRELPAAYDQYVAFEDLRRDLDSIPRVTAFEVAPGDRLQRLLASRRARTTGT